MSWDLSRFSRLRCSQKKGDHPCWIRDLSATKNRRPILEDPASGRRWCTSRTSTASKTSWSTACSGCKTISPSGLLSNCDWVETEETEYAMILRQRTWLRKCPMEISKFPGDGSTKEVWPGWIGLNWASCEGSYHWHQLQELFLVQTNR